MLNAKLDEIMNKAAQEFERQRRERVLDELQSRSFAAEKMIKQNPPYEHAYGCDGFIQIIAMMTDRSQVKRRCAETIIRIRRNRIACKKMGRNYRQSSAKMLNSIAHWRKTYLSEKPGDEQTSHLERVKLLSHARKAFVQCSEAMADLLSPEDAQHIKEVTTYLLEDTVDCEIRKIERSNLLKRI